MDVFPKMRGYVLTTFSNIYDFFQVRMLSSSLLRALLFLLVTSYVSAKKNNTTYSDQEVKNQTSEKRQSIGKWLLTVTP